MGKNQKIHFYKLGNLDQKCGILTIIVVSAQKQVESSVLLNLEMRRSGGVELEESPSLCRWLPSPEFRQTHSRRPVLNQRLLNLKEFSISVVFVSRRFGLYSVQWKTTYRGVAKGWA